MKSSMLRRGLFSLSLIAFFLSANVAPVEALFIEEIPKSLSLRCLRLPIPFAFKLICFVDPHGVSGFDVILSFNSEEVSFSPTESVFFSPFSSSNTSVVPEIESVRVTGSIFPSFITESQDVIGLTFDCLVPDAEISFEITSATIFDESGNPESAELPPPQIGKCSDFSPAGLVASFTGRAHGVGIGKNTAGVAIVGTFTSTEAIDLSAIPEVTLTSLFNEVGSVGEAVADLPLTLVADPRNNANVARFKTPVGVLPIAKVTIGAKGGGEFTFRVNVAKATIEPPSQCPATNLSTIFTIGGVDPPVLVITTQSWLCFGARNQYLKQTKQADLKPFSLPIPGGFCQVVDNQIQLQVFVGNVGSADAGPSKIKADFSPYGFVIRQTDPIPADFPRGRSRLIVIKPPPGCFDPDCDFTITVDSDNEVDEGPNEGNNTAAGVCLG